MQITKDTRVSDILLQYGDIADVMEVFGVRRVGRYSLRMFLAKALTVEWAARPSPSSNIAGQNSVELTARFVIQLFLKENNLKEKAIKPCISQ